MGDGDEGGRVEGGGAGVKISASLQKWGSVIAS